MMVQNTWNAVEKVILERRSVRLYEEDKQVPEDLVCRILEAGRFAPSAGNCQPWRFIVIREKDIINELTNATVEVCKTLKSILTAGHPPMPIHPVPYGATQLIADGKLGLWHGAPTVILICKDVRGIQNPDLDCGIAGQNMVLAAHSLGLGTCWVSFVVQAFNFVPGLKERFRIEYPWELITSIGIGYSAGDPDGMVDRDTHATEWYENGTKIVRY